MGRRSEQTFLKRRHTDSQQAHEKMLNITNHQVNANQNYNEISPQTCQNGYHQKTTKCWQGCGEKGTLIHRWQECKLVQPLWKQYRGSSKELPYDPAIPLLGVYLKKMKTNLKRYMHPHVHCSIISNSQDIETRYRI